MRIQYDNNLITSFFLYAENLLQQNAQAYQTLTMKLFPTEDRFIPAGYTSYSAPLRGWVYNSGVSGAHIINSISGGGFSAPLTRASGIHIDYTNGRALVPTSLGSNLDLTGTASFTEINLFIPAESQNELLTQSKYFVNPRTVYPLTESGALPYVYVTPAIFVNTLNTKNEAFNLGGMVMTKSNISLTVIAESNNQLTALLGLWRDTRYRYFPILNAISDPLDEWGDVKGGTGYNYLSYVKIFGRPGNLAYIEDVTTARVSDRLKLDPAQWVGIVDLEVSYLRQSPQSNIFV